MYNIQFIFTIRKNIMTKEKCGSFLKKKKKDLVRNKHLIIIGNYSFLTSKIGIIIMASSS